MIDWKRYLIAFLITAGIFASIFYISNYLNNKKFAYLKETQDEIAMSILSSEVEFDLLEQKKCEDVGDSVLSAELGDLGSRLAYTERQLGADDRQVITLKSYYSLLQIKDYLLMLSIAEKCKTQPIFVLYFYSNDPACEDCVKENYVIELLRAKYPELKIYSFDYDLELDAKKTLVSIYNVPDVLPTIVINNKVYSGFQSLEDIEKTLPLAMRKKAQLKEEESKKEDIKGEIKNSN